jgi:hypothetical protein
MLATVALAVVFGLAARVIELRRSNCCARREHRVFPEGLSQPVLRACRQYAWQSVVTLCIAVGHAARHRDRGALGLLGAHNISPHPSSTSGAAHDGRAARGQRVRLRSCS